jgi:hypothetical protein
MEEKLFGALEVDIKVPDDLKSKFAEMPPIFKNIEVSHENLRRRKKGNESTLKMSGRKYVWRKDHGYFTFAEVVCGTRLESDPDPSSGGVHACSLLPEIRRQHQ